MLLLMKKGGRKSRGQRKGGESKKRRKREGGEGKGSERETRSFN